jgi:hypothetical protein
VDRKMEIKTEKKEYSSLIGGFRLYDPPLESELKIQPIILAGTDGDDYSVLDKVDPRIKELAVEGKIEGRRLDVVIQNDGSGVLYPNYEMDIAVKEATKDTLEEAYGDGVKILTPENKHWILRQMGFKGIGKGKWKNYLFEEEIEFDLETDSLFQLAFRIHKTGYQNAQAEERIGWKTPVQPGCKTSTS